MKVRNMSKERESFNYIKTFMDTLDDDFYSEDVDIVDKGLQRLEEIDNADPSEAMECLECLYSNPEDYNSNDRAKDYDTIKQYILKTQEPKCYLRWEDLEFEEEEQTMKVLLNGKKYILSYFTDGIYKFIDLLTDNEKYQMGRYVDCYSYNVQFFNDLHLERVEE